MFFNPSSDRQKLKQNKLHTFTKRATTARETKNREKNLSTILANAFKLLQSGDKVLQTCKYPLALSDIHGNMRPSNKSTFKEAIKKLPTLSSMYCYNCPFNLDPYPVALFIDFLYFVHIPPPNHILTYKDFAKHLWNEAVELYVKEYNIGEVYIVVDKPEFLPPPRQIVHKSRKSKTKPIPFCMPQIGDMDDIFHGKEYTTLLTDIEFKSQLLAYVFHQFINFAATSCVPVIVIDSPSFDSVKVVRDRSICNLNRNEHGEADYAIWYHVTKSSVSKTLIFV